jgi:uncharacterized protein YcaQ
MKFGITRFEKLAMTSHLVGLPSPNPEHGRRRLQAWDELGVEELADSIATGVAFGQGTIPITAADWTNKKDLVLVDLSSDVLAYLIAGLTPNPQAPMSGAWADPLTRLRERLEQLRDKKYKLPEELRDRKGLSVVEGAKK